MKKIIDISVPLSPELPVWPNDQKVEIFQQSSIKIGEAFNLTNIKISSHTGTHIDAPLHFIENGNPIEKIPLDKLIGKCQVIDCRGLKKITANDLEKSNIPVGTEKLLIKTDNSILWENPKHTFKKDYCALTADAAQWVADNNIHLIGIDYASIQLYTDPPDTHVILLSNEIVILENIDLRFVEPNEYRLICLPIKINGVEGTVARVVLEIV